MTKKIYEYVRRFLRKASEDSLPAYAAQATFFVGLSFFPFVVLMIIITSRMTFASTNIISYIFEVVPNQLNPYVLYVVDEILYSRSESFTVITIIVSLWSSSKVFQALAYGLNKIYGIEKLNNYFATRLVSAIYTLIFVLMCVIIMLVNVFGTAILRYMVSRLFPSENMTVLIVLVKNIFIFVILCCLLVLVYYRLPDRKSSFLHEIGGAVFATATWMLMTKGFTFYIKYIASSSYMYGGLSSVILVFIWMYIGMQIILYGAMFNFFFGDGVVKYFCLLKNRKKYREKT